MAGNKSIAQIAMVAIFTVHLIIALPPSTEAANILFFIGFGGPSHRLAMEPLANALSLKGHNVTFLVQDMPKISGNNTKIQYYVPKKVAQFFEDMRKGSDAGGGINFYDMRAAGRGVFMNVFIQWFGIQVCENMYNDPEFLSWLHTVPKFDLVIMDGLFNECGYGIAHAHGAKTILFSISTVLPWAIEMIGVPDESSWIPDVMLSIPLNMNFAHRVIGAVAPILWRTFRSWVYMPSLERITKEGLKQSHFPSFVELERNTSLVFLNTHPAQEFPRALPPNVIPVGGISWVEKKKILPKEMEDFISQGKEGFIYVSFGSFIDFLTFPEEVQQTFIDALRQFPNIQFIWKLNKTPANLPKHILVKNWLPQQDLLFHPKIRAFITHSGIGGVNEAIYSSVPLICFPLFSEQDYNAQLVQKRGFGIKMEITALTQEDLVAAIQKMITDNSYKETAKKVTQQFLDRPMKPVDVAVWWTEYVLRQESTEFLRSFNVDQPWWKKRQLDVWLFLLVLTILLNSLGLYISYKVLKRCFMPNADRKSLSSNGIVGKSGKLKNRKPKQN